MNKMVSFRNYVVVLVFFIVLLSVTSLSEKTLFVAHGKQSKHYMTSKG